MFRSDYRVIFTALGFMAMAQKEGLTETDRNTKAIALARLIESFCYITVPEAFLDDEECIQDLQNRSLEQREL